MELGTEIITSSPVTLTKLSGTNHRSKAKSPMDSFSSLQDCLQIRVSAFSSMGALALKRASGCMWGRVGGISGSWPKNFDLREVKLLSY